MDPEVLHIPLCPFRAVTGWDCPACGSLRAAWDLLHLRVGEALDHNVLLVVALPLLLVVVMRRRSGAPAVMPEVVSSRIATALMVLLLVAFTVVRNLPAGAWLAASA